MFDKDEADQMVDAFSALAMTVPCIQVKYEARRRALEWRRAAVGWEEAVAYGIVAPTITTFGAVLPGMQVWYAGMDSRSEPWLEVVRQMRQGGQVTLHLDGEGRAVYQNFHSEASPVVVRL